MIHEYTSLKNKNKVSDKTHPNYIFERLPESLTKTTDFRLCQEKAALSRLWEIAFFKCCPNLKDYNVYKILGHHGPIKKFIKFLESKTIKK